jgi:hypothetical protein
LMQMLAAVHTCAVHIRVTTEGTLPRQGTHVVTSFCMTPAKLEAIDFTHSRMGNTYPARCRPNTVRVLFITLCRGRKRM